MEKGQRIIELIRDPARLAHVAGGEKAVVAAHYCCELGEAALAARDFDAARAHLASAPVVESLVAARVTEEWPDGGIVVFDPTPGGSRVLPWGAVASATQLRTALIAEVALKTRAA